jgi:four helix bundle protein
VRDAAVPTLRRLVSVVPAGLVRNYRDLDVYRSAVDAALEVFHDSEQFPDREKYSLTDQVRRSSRSVCANLAEAWRKRRYKAAFVAKLNDVEGEAAETQVWLELASRCGYLPPGVFKVLVDRYEKIIAQAVKMARNADGWAVPRVE